MKMSKIVFSLSLVAGLIITNATEAGWPPVRVEVKSLGPYQQKMLAKGFGSAVEKGVTHATGNPVIGKAVGTAAGNHAQKKWTGKGLQNWNKPKRW